MSCNCIDSAMAENVILGTKLKYVVEITADGFSMMDDNFTITLKSGQVVKEYTKSQLVQGDDDKFYLCFDTKDFGRGLIKATVTAYVPDEYFEDGYRTEIEKINLINVNA